MRIGLNAAFLGKGHNGISTYTRGLINALRDHGSSDGQEYLVYTSSEDDVPREPNFTWRRTLPFLRAEHGAFGNSLRLLWTQCILPRMLKKDRVDVLLSTLPESPIFSKTPRVVFVHDLIPLFYPKECPRLVWYVRGVLPSVVRRAEEVVTVSEHTKQDLVREFGIKGGSVTVIPSAVHDLYYSSNGLHTSPPNCPEKYFLFVGACVPRKNPLGVIRAYAQIQSRVEHKLVLVTSTGSYLNEVKRVVEDLGLSDRVVFYSGLPHHEMMLFLYRHATALVFLSEYEGFGGPVAEAMAAGTPAIVSASSSLPWVVGDAGVVVPVDDLPAAAIAMLNLALNERVRELLRERGLIQRERFRWRVVTEKLSSVLLTAINGNG
jgi:glycosyltransferase involved in cell wall biosynthesis